jgi:hypothetical protein
MIFHDADTLSILITVFFAVAAASVAFAATAVTIAVRRPHPASGSRTTMAVIPTHQVRFNGSSQHMA